MQQYLDLLKAIKDKGTYKQAARENIPGTQSLFGYQFRHNLADGFPLLTTKKVSFKNVVVELLWFLRGDTNIKYLVDNGCNIWNEDAYNYYLKKCKEDEDDEPVDFDFFIKVIKDSSIQRLDLIREKDLYTLGDCGYQYGKVWMKWETQKEETYHEGETYPSGEYKWKHRYKTIDQISNVIYSLRNNPESRRHIVTAVDPAHDTDLALYWCHSMFQFNCRPLDIEERENYASNVMQVDTLTNNGKFHGIYLTEEYNVPKYYLDCHLYQRSADVFLGVPYNIASYSLLTHIFAKMCNMIPGEFIHSFGDVHIYDNHQDQVDEQLTRTPGTLPTLSIADLDWDNIINHNFETLIPDYFQLKDYNPQPAIKAKLSTGLLK